MKRKSFNSPPRDRGPRANRKMLTKVSQHCLALGAYSTRTNPMLAQQLSSVGKELDVYASTAPKKIDIYPSIFAMCSCLSNLKSAIDLGTDCTAIMAKLVGEMDTLVELLKTGVSSIDDSPLRNKQIQRFIANQRQVQTIYEMTMTNYMVARQTGSRTAEVWEASSSVLKGILDSLTELKGYALVSSSLSRKINRVTNTRRLADFFNNPIRAQNESLRVNSQLSFIIKNVTEAFRSKQALDAVQAGYIGKLSRMTSPQAMVAENLAPILDRTTTTESCNDTLGAV